MSDNRNPASADPTITVLSLGAGVQSTTIALLACEGRLPRPDAAIFADVRWEPRAVYDHLDRLAVELNHAGIPLYRVSHGDLRADTVNTGKFIRLPAFVQGTDGRAAMLRRQCTERYKLDPIKRQIRLLLGAQRSRTGAVLSPPAGRVAEQWVGFSTDEIGRVSNHHDSRYLRTCYPLLDLGWSRGKCLNWLAARGWGSTPKSACVGCPFHGNRQWRQLRDTCMCGHHRDKHWRFATGPTGTGCAVVIGEDRSQPTEDGTEFGAITCDCPAFRNPEWTDAVGFDRQLRERTFQGPHQVPFLHRSLLPLDQAPIDKVTRGEWRERQGDLLDLIDLDEDGDPDGCSPHGCRSGQPVTSPEDDTSTAATQQARDREVSA